MVGCLIHDSSPEFLFWSCFLHAIRSPLRSKTLLRVAVNGVPDTVGRRRHFQPVVADRVRDGVDDGGGRADRARLAASLDAQWIAWAERRGACQFDRLQ